MKKSKQRRHVFISPHLDDAVLSAGNLLVKLRSKQESVIIITVFTSFGAYPPSDDAMAFMKSCGYSTTGNFQKQRHKEERDATKILHAKPTFLNFTDGLFRIIRSLLGRSQPIYPSFSQLLRGQISPLDDNLRKTLTSTLRQAIQDDDILYAPLGIGNHVDHIIVHRVLRELFGQRTHFWLDQPYALAHRANVLKDFNLVMKLPTKPEKKKILHAYSSQIRILYPNGLRLLSEEFYRLL